MVARKAGESPAAAEAQQRNAGIPLRNAKHEAVLQAYIADPERVGYRCYIGVYPNSGEGAAKTAFSRLLKNADFAGRLSFLTAAVTDRAIEKAAVTIEGAVAELAKLGFANIQDYVKTTSDGDPYIDLSGVSRDQAAAIQSITIEDYVDGRGDDARDVKKINFRLHNKEAALVDIIRHLGGFPAQKHELTGAGGGPMKHEVEDAGALSERELGRRILFALERAARAPQETGRKKPKKG